MLNIKEIRENFNQIKESLEKRNKIYIKTLENIKNLDNEYIVLLKKVEILRKKRNENSKNIGFLKRNNKKLEFKNLTEEMNTFSKKIKEEEEKLKKLKKDLDILLLNIPNKIDITVPAGKDENFNIEISRHDKPRKFDFNKKNHWQLGVELDILDFERASKMSGSRFTIFKNDGAHLIRALINFMLDTHIEFGYKELMTPVIVKEDSLFKTGHLPKFETDLFKMTEKEFYLIPTAEVTLTNYYSNEIIDFTSDKIIKMTAYTQCFRSEAGAAGKDTKGVIRQHQFDKVELVNITTPDNSQKALEDLKSQAEEILKRLKLPYRTIVLCSGDTGFSSSKTYDIEVWLPSYDDYKEISSCSNCLDFQAIRSNIKYKDNNGKYSYVHTLNGSGVAIGRAFAAIIENYQNKDGSITIPEVLRPYMNNKTLIK